MFAKCESIEFSINWAHGDEIGVPVLEEDITKWTLSLTQPHKTDSWSWGLHALIYNEIL